MLKAKYTKPLTISLPPELYEKIEEESDRQEISKGKYVRRLLENGMKVENDDEQRDKTKRKKTG
jgi:metal-responsive CopG/Arc/MetJ family transcriptional regulator